MIRALIFILIFVVGCINKPPSSSQYLEKGYFEDLSFLRESPGSKITTSRKCI